MPGVGVPAAGSRQCPGAQGRGGPRTRAERPPRLRRRPGPARRRRRGGDDPQDENKIGIDGIQQFCDDLSLDPASISVLVIAWKFRAATQCEFSRKEFLDGMTELGCDSMEKLKALLPRLEQELKDTAKFKDFYQFTFTFAKNPGQKGLGSPPFLNVRALHH